MKSELNRKRKRVEADQCGDDFKENFHPFSEKEFPRILKENTRTSDVASGPDTQSHHLILSRSEEMTHNPGKTEEDYEYTGTGSAPLTKKSKQGDPTSTVMADHIQTSTAAHPSDILKSFAREENPGFLQNNHLTNLVKSHKETQKTDMNTVGVTPVENTVESYRCLICYRSFPRLNYLKNHTRMSHDKNQHASNTKSKKSPSLRNELKLHGSSLTKERLFECGFCGNSFFTSHHRDTHLLIHLGEKHYSCHLCEKSFIQKGNLNAHLKTHIREMSKSEIVDLNRQIGVQLPALAGEKRQESQNIDSNGQRTGVKFFARGKPQKSQNKDENGQNIVEKPHKCSSCPKSFRFPAKLKVHVRVHTGERPYKCSLCSKAYTQSHNLKIHLVTHTGVKPYKCKYCLKLFSYGANLNRHQKTHAEEKLESVSQ